MISAEVEAEMALNPIVKRAAELATECYSLATIGGKSQWWPEDEEPPPAADPANPDWDVDARIAWLDSRPRVGAAVAVETGYGRVERIVWVRNIDYPGMTAVSLAGDIAELLAWKDAHALIKLAIGEGRPLQSLPAIEIRTSTR